MLIGAQDCSAVAEDAARTGEISAAMLADAGARYVIVGHSERRAQHGETDGLVRQKAEAALAAGLTPIVCVGETQAERAAGKAAEVVGAPGARQRAREQRRQLVVAYEPVWAIGGDRTPTLAEIAEIHAVVRERAGRALRRRPRTTCASSMAARSARRTPREIFAAEGVDGALVGRASLKAADFSAIILAHPAAT